MKAKVVNRFRDKITKVVLEVGQEIEVTDERLEEINSTAYGVFLIGIDLANGKDKTVINGQVIDEAIDEDETVEDEVKIEDLNVKQIKELLDQMNIKYGPKMKKDELIALIKVGD